MIYTVIKNYNRSDQPMKEQKLFMPMVIMIYSTTTDCTMLFFNGIKKETMTQYHKLYYNYHELVFFTYPSSKYRPINCMPIDTVLHSWWLDLILPTVLFAKYSGYDMILNNLPQLLLSVIYCLTKNKNLAPKSSL